jgi:putative endonuclease
MNPALHNDWHYVYLLCNKNNGGIYIGCTSNLDKRFKEHSEGKVYSTRRMLPMELVYYEAYRDKDCAYKREKSLKTYGSGLRNLKGRLGVQNKGRAG